MDKQIDKSEIRRRKMRLIAKWCVGLLGAGAVVGLALSLAEKSVKREDLVFSTADVGEIATTVSASGTVVAAYEETVNSPVNSHIVEIFAQPGDSVKAGQKLLALDLSAEQTNYDKMVDRHRISREELHQQQLSSRTALSELAMQIEVKEMEVGRLKIDVDNERKLDSLGSGTGERVRQAETAYKAGLLELKQMRERLANERLRSQAADNVQALNVSTIEKDLALMARTLNRGTIPAPHDGILTFIVSEIGAQISAGQKLAVVSDLSSFKIRGEIAEGNADRINIGSTATVRIGKVELTGRVTNLTPQSKGGVISFIVTLDDPRHTRLRSGMHTEIYVDYGYKDNVVRIANGPYFKSPGEYELFVADGDNRLVRRTVRLGESNRQFVEVVDGLRKGDKVVVGDMSKYQSKKKLNIK